MVIKALFDLIARIEPEIDFMQFKNAKAIIVIYELLDRNVGVLLYLDAEYR